MQAVEPKNLAHPLPSQIGREEVSDRCNRCHRCHHRPGRYLHGHAEARPRLCNKSSDAALTREIQQLLPLMTICGARLVVFALSTQPPTKLSPSSSLVAGVIFLTGLNRD